MSPEKKTLINDFGKAIARILTTHREDAGITQMQLADRTGISQSQISKQLRGLRAIDMDDLSAICDSLDISMIDVIREAENQVSESSHPDDLAARRSPASTPDVHALGYVADSSDDEEEGDPGDYEA